MKCASATGSSGLVLLTLAAIAGKSYRIRSVMVDDPNGGLAGLDISPLQDHLGNSFTMHLNSMGTGAPATFLISGSIWFLPFEPEEKGHWLVSVPGQAVTFAYEDAQSGQGGAAPNIKVWYESW